MMRMPLIVIGAGQVARALVGQLLQARALHEERDGLRLPVIAWCDSQAAVVNTAGIEPDVLVALSAGKEAGAGFISHPAANRIPRDLTGWIDSIGSGPCLVADVTASDATAQALIRALELGCRVATANKIPLTAAQEQFEQLAGSLRFRYESTVGSAVPVIASTRALVRAADHVDSIQGVLSGTLGFLCTGLQAGRPFSECLHQAMERGYTEPDPRIDLAGMDVARKALILARTLGWRFELADVEVEPLLPVAFASLPLDEFLDRAHEMDRGLTADAMAAKQQGKVLRYVADIRPTGIRVGLTRAPIDSALGSLKGNDNLVAFHTRNYPDEPLVIQGRGAGVQAAAAGVHSDLVALALGE